MTRTVALIVAAAVSPALAQQENTPPEQPRTGQAEAKPAAAGDQALVSLTNGDLMRGTLVSDGDPVVLDHPVLGRVSFPRSAVASVRTMSAENATKATAAASEAAAKVPPPPPPPDPDSWLKGWKGAIEGGLNGSSGNTENLSLRFGIGAARETTQTKTALSLTYNYATDDGDKSADNARFDARNDWLPQGGSKWRPFVQGTVEYDTFQDWNWRTTAFAGVGYELIKTDTFLLLPRLGIGLSKEFGGEDNKIHPEGLAALDAEWKIDERSKLFATIESYWLLDDLPDYRLFGKAGYEVIVDPKSGMTLKLGVEDRYDSSPGDAKNRNDVTYFATVAIPF